MPRVSIILPVYNGGKFLREAIDSVLGQSYNDFELVVIDDGSTDDSVAIIQSYSNSRIKLLRNGMNLGITKSLNNGIAAAAGEYLCRMDADDISMPERLKLQVGYLDGHPDIAMVGSAVILIDSNGREAGRKAYPATPVQIRKSIFVHNPFAHGTIMVRASVIKECGGYDERFLHNEDYDLWFRIAARHNLANLETRLLKRRVHDLNITVEKETELVRFRMKTLSNAIFHYYHRPHYSIYLLRPFLAYQYRRMKQALK